MRPSATLLAAATLSAIAAAPTRAQECGMPVRYYEDAPRVADADAAPVRDALDAGDYAAVARLARARVNAPQLERRARAFELRAGRKFNEEEVRIALAAAVIRTAGEEGITAAPKKAGSKREQQARRRQNLETARDLLQQEMARASGDPVIATLLGEAHLALGESEYAAAILEDLASADLIVSPEGWAALARAREATGNVDLAAQAQKRCEDAARDAAVCTRDRVAARS